MSCLVCRNNKLKTSAGDRGPGTLVWSCEVNTKLCVLFYFVLRCNSARTDFAGGAQAAGALTLSTQIYLRRGWRRRRRAQAKYQRARIGRGQRHHARGVLPRGDAPARRGLPDAWGAAQRLSAGLEDELVLGHAARRGAWCIAQCVTTRTACTVEPAMRRIPVDYRVVGIPLRCTTHEQREPAAGSAADALRLVRVAPWGLA